jgi:hypothetical protein
MPSASTTVFASSAPGTFRPTELLLLCRSTVSLPAGTFTPPSTPRTPTPLLTRPRRGLRRSVTSRTDHHSTRPASSVSGRRWRIGSCLGAALLPIPSAGGASTGTMLHDRTKFTSKQLPEESRNLKRFPPRTALRDLAAAWPPHSL